MINITKTDRVFTAITISLIILTCIGIGGTYLSDYLISIDWFGDYDKIEYADYKERYVTYHFWGARHYWYNWGIALLFITSLVRAVVKVVMIIEEK